VTIAEITSVKVVALQDLDKRAIFLHEMLLNPVGVKIFGLRVVQVWIYIFVATDAKESGMQIMNKRIPNFLFCEHFYFQELSKYASS
jgi:hypothetical protein